MNLIEFSVVCRLRSAGWRPHHNNPTKVRFCITGFIWSNVHLRVTAATGIDAMVHAIGFLCMNKNSKFQMQYSKFISWDIKHWNVWHKASILNVSSFRGIHFEAQEKCFVRRSRQGDNVRKHKNRNKTSQNLRNCPNSRYLQEGQVCLLTLVWRL